MDKLFHERRGERRNKRPLTDQTFSLLVFVGGAGGNLLRDDELANTGTCKSPPLSIRACPPSSTSRVERGNRGRRGLGRFADPSASAYTNWCSPASHASARWLPEGIYLADTAAVIGPEAGDGDAPASSLETGSRLFDLDRRRATAGRRDRREALAGSE